MEESYDYDIQISTSEGMPEWVHETIGQSFHIGYNQIRVIDAWSRINNLKRAGFEIDYVRKRVNSAWKHV